MRTRLLTGVAQTMFVFGTTVARLDKISWVAVACCAVRLRYRSEARLVSGYAEPCKEDVTLLVFGSESLGRCNVATRAQQQSKAETVNLQGEGPMVLLKNVEVHI